MFILVPAAIAAVPSIGWSATVAIAASQDNTIFENSVNNSAGGSAGIFAGTNGQGSPRRGLIAFDVAGNIPAGATITSAELTLHLGLSPDAANATVGLYRLNADWGEGISGSTFPTIGGAGQGFTASTGDATWAARFHSSSPWSMPGAAGDFNPVASASVVIGGSGTADTSYTWLSTPALVVDVQSWLDSAGSNFGWALINTDEVSSRTVRAFYSSEATLDSTGGALDPSWRPTLVVTYVPEPASLLLLLSAGLLVLAVARRYDGGNHV